MMFSLVLVIGLILVACSGDDEAGDAEQEPEQDIEQEVVEDPVQDVEEPGKLVSEDERLSADDVVAIINGQEIKGDQYNIVYSDTKGFFLQQGQNVDDLAFVMEQTVTSLVSQTLILQDADSLGITVDDDEVDELFTQTKARFESEEEFEEALQELAYTEQSYRNQLILQIKQETYITQEFSDVNVTTEEIEEMYAHLQGQMNDLPPLEEVSGELEAQLAQNQMQTKLAERIEQLRDQADIEKNI